MTAPLSNDELTTWAREHLVYEAGMLAYTTGCLAARVGQPRNADSNVLVESFAIHVRCLDDFLWGKRGGRYKFDALAADFCSPGVWERERPSRPPALVATRKRDRTGREIVHLSYHRLHVPPAIKDWPVGEIAKGIIGALGDLAGYTLPERLDGNTRDRLRDLPIAASPVVTSGSGSTGTQQMYTGGTIEYRDR